MFPGATPAGLLASDGNGGITTRHQAPAAEVFAILTSSALFALMHVSHGAAPIPLFVLALGLGFVYARTGRVLPCIVIHVWLNAWSLVTLWIGTVVGPGS
jgi:membrane protease YdiL (CAAX protease family)